MREHPWLREWRLRRECQLSGVPERYIYAIKGLPSLLAFLRDEEVSAEGRVEFADTLDIIPQCVVLHVRCAFAEDAIRRRVAWYRDQKCFEGYFAWEAEKRLIEIAKRVDQGDAAPEEMHIEAERVFNNPCQADPWFSKSITRGFAWRDGTSLGYMGTGARNGAQREAELKWRCDYLASSLEAWIVEEAARLAQRRQAAEERAGKQARTYPIYRLYFPKEFFLPDCSACHEHHYEIEVEEEKLCYACARKAGHHKAIFRQEIERIKTTIGVEQ